MVRARKFQFTPLREGRLPPRPAYAPKPIISIHAPPRGATRRGRLPLQKLLNFNSRPSARGDRRGRLPLQKLLNFNSRPSARGDIRGCVYRGIELFQFTPLREGRPLEVFAQDVEFLISIHAPPRGATGTGRITSLTRMYFNSRPSARGDVLSRGFTKSMIISIHAPPRGATGHLPSRIPRRFYFNSRPSARGDARWITIKKTRRNFNSRPSARGDSIGQTKTFGIFLFQFTPLREGRPCVDRA